MYVITDGNKADETKGSETMKRQKELSACTVKELMKIKGWTREEAEYAKKEWSESLKKLEEQIKSGKEIDLLGF